MTHDEIIAIIEAHKEGKTIQFKEKFSEEWNDCVNNDPLWNFGTIEYRVKPEENKVKEEQTAITKEWLQEMIDCSQASADAYNALGKVDQYNYFLGQKDMCILLLNNLYNVPFDSRISALDKTKRKNIIDSIFENFKPQ